MDCMISLVLLLAAALVDYVVSVGLVLDSGGLHRISRTGTVTIVDCVVSV